MNNQPISPEYFQSIHQLHFVETTTLPTNTFSLQKVKHTSLCYECTFQVRWNLRIIQTVNANWMTEESERSQSKSFRNGFNRNESIHLPRSVYIIHTLDDNYSHVVEIVPAPFEPRQGRKICKSPMSSGSTSHRQLVGLVVVMPVAIERTVIHSNGTEIG